MPHPLSTKLDATLHYASGLYGLATSVLAQITAAAAAATAAQTKAVTADGKAVTADGKAVTAQAAAATADAKAVTADGKAVAAQTAAATADGKAVAAQTAATSAQTTANAAQTAAATADAKAVTADGKAVTAQTAVTSATTTANTASSTATAASTAAASATTTANAASAAATSATTTANNALTTANAATVAAIDARNTALLASSDADTAQMSFDAHAGTGATAHALATASVHGFLPSTDKTKLDALAAGQAATVGRLTVDAILESPTTFAYASSVPLNTSIKNDFAQSDVLTGNIAFTFPNAAANQQGKFSVRQDATGGRTVTITAPAGWTLYRDSNTSNLTAAAGANAVTIYTYAFEAVGGVNVMFIGKLTPVAA
jgi:hypothetical protein